MNKVIIGDPTSLQRKAQLNQLYIQQLAQVRTKAGIEIGFLLLEAKENRYYEIHGYDCIEDYGIATLNTSRKKVHDLIDIVELIALPSGFTPEQLKQWTETSLLRLLPLARRGELTEEWMEKAHELPDLALRHELGHKIPEYDIRESINCPWCSQEIIGAKWVSKKGEVRKNQD